LGIWQCELYTFVSQFHGSLKRLLLESRTEQLFAQVETSPSLFHSNQSDGCQGKIASSKMTMMPSFSHFLLALAIVWAKGTENHICLLPLFSLTKFFYSFAYAEMRLILARLLFSFDFELVDKENRWDEQSAFILYQKPPLMLHVKPRQE
jgi:hypothetical protein